ncbi:PREDICTED: uncharacterized protein LOC107161444 [Diuraphis noxia]|uniref:uncharacterized protein LOC107161444 n=1 Tax=Diuraphis noxia TaxID=143948 RepID=UPI00076381B9|nr:PREDICTED: uncharacterized protein LOC107161444 [Diuraphis noxia]XP_015363341.1 PREDICTED: uncharacterized protein LOC107161444 [Diuraphis noxia]
MSEQSIDYTFDAGAIISNKQKPKKKQNNSKNKVSGVKKNKVAKKILDDWVNDGCIYSENLNLDTSGTLPISNEVVPKNKLSNTKIIMSEQTTRCTLDAGVTTSNKEKRKRKEKNNLKNNIKKNKVVEELLKDWESDD